MLNPWIDVGLWMVAVGAVFAAWPFVRELGVIFDEIEDEAIRKQIEKDRNDG